MKNRYVVVQCWSQIKSHEIYGPYSYNKARKVLESRRELIKDGVAREATLTIAPVRK